MQPNNQAPEHKHFRQRPNYSTRSYDVYVSSDTYEHSYHIYVRGVRYERYTVYM